MAQNTRDYTPTSGPPVCDTPSLHSFLWYELHNVQILSQHWDNHALTRTLAEWAGAPRACPPESGEPAHSWSAPSRDSARPLDSGVLGCAPEAERPKHLHDVLHKDIRIVLRKHVLGFVPEADAKHLRDILIHHSRSRSLFPSSKLVVATFPSSFCMKFPSTGFHHGAREEIEYFECCRRHMDIKEFLQVTLLGA